MIAGPTAGALAPGSVLDSPHISDVSLADLVEVAEAVRRDPAGLRSWLDRVLRHPVELEALAARSYLHANGFAKVVLHSLPDAAVKLRLHVWEDDAGPEIRGESDPHGHRWDFVSTVVAGAGLDVVHLRESDRGEPYERYGYDPHGGDLVHEGRRLLEVVERSRRGRQDIYRCRTDVVHTIEPVGRGLVATVVVQGPDRMASTPVYRQSADARLKPRTPLGVDELVRFLEAVVEALAEDGFRRLHSG